MTDRHQLIIITEDKQAMIQALEATMNQGQDYADLCLEILVKAYHVDPGLVDLDTLKEMTTGYIIGCQIRQEKPSDPAEYLVKNLAIRSNLGLAKLGLAWGKMT